MNGCIQREYPSTVASIKHSAVRYIFTDVFRKRVTVNAGTLWQMDTIEAIVFNTVFLNVASHSNRCCHISSTFESDRENSALKLFIQSKHLAEELNEICLIVRSNHDFMLFVIRSLRCTIVTASLVC
jgi:hypothetical protein